MFATFMRFIMYTTVVGGLLIVVLGNHTEPAKPLSVKQSVSVSTSKSVVQSPSDAQSPSKQQPALEPERQVEPRPAVKVARAGERTPSVEVVATGYTAGYESTGKTPAHPDFGITYSGVRVVRATYSTIAADLRVFPLGTILYIPDYGYGVVADIGGAIKGHKIDLYFDTVHQVYENWGKKRVRVQVIRYGNGSLRQADLDRLNNRRHAL